MELFVPDPEEVKKAYDQETIPFPYWSQVWPAAIALSQFIIRNKELVQKKNVLELAAGLGLPSLVAASFARSVLCTDHVAEAVDVAQCSASHLHLHNFQTAVIDWNNLPEDLDVDMLLLSDVNYDPSAFISLQKALQDFLRKGTSVILSTPQRLMAKGFIEPLIRSCMQKEEYAVFHQGNERMITIMALEGKEKGES